MITRRYASTQHGQVHYRIAGNGDALVLLGPAGRSAAMYDPLSELLANQFRVLAIDMLGHGGSDPLPEGASIDMLAQCVAGVLGAEGIAQAHVYGLHTGNKIAAALSARWSTRVNRVVLCGQSHSLIPDAAARNATILGLVRHYFPAPGSDSRAHSLGRWSEAFSKLAQAWWPPEIFTANNPDEVTREIRARIIDELQSMDSGAALYSANFAYDLAADLAKIRGPTLVIEIVTPEEDRKYGRQGEAVRKLIPHAQLATIEERDGGFATLENRAEELSRLLTNFCSAER
ncbi:MAG: alpha/beta fold hydrolase [Burkholderiales bacterium]